MARARTRELGRENRRLQDLATQLQEKHHRISLEVGFGLLGLGLEPGQDLGQMGTQGPWSQDPSSKHLLLSLSPVF